MLYSKEKNNSVKRSYDYLHLGVDIYKKKKKKEGKTMLNGKPKVNISN